MKTLHPRLLATAVLWSGALLAAPVTARAAASPGAPAAASRPSTEYDVKAVFILNFARFVDWPDDAFASAQAPFVIGIFGESPILASLRVAITDETIRRRPIVLRALTPADDPRRCQIVFVSRAERSQFPSLRSRLAGAPVLTIGESEKFCEQGGMFNFVLDARSVRFEINRKATTEAGLRVSARLLQLARLVNEKD